MPHYLLIKDKLKGNRKARNQSHRAVVWRTRAVIFFRTLLKVSKLPARRIGRSRDTETNKFDQAGSEFVSTVLEKHRRNSIQTVSLPRIKVTDGRENVITKFFNFRDEVIRRWRSRMNIPSIIQSRVWNKDLSEELSFRERRDSCGVICLK